MSICIAFDNELSHEVLSYTDKSGIKLPTKRICKPKMSKTDFSIST